MYSENIEKMKKFIAAALVIMPATIWAHPGHGTTDGYTITHYFTEAPHVLVSLSVMAVSALVILMIKNRKKQQA